MQALNILCFYIAYYYKKIIEEMIKYNNNRLLNPVTLKVSSIRHSGFIQKQQ